MRGLTKTEIKELVLEVCPKAQFEVRHLSMKISAPRSKRKVRALLDRLVIPYWLTVEVI